MALGAANAQTMVNSSKTQLAGGQAAGDLIKNFEFVYGGAGNDKITGNGGDNCLVGKDGNDTLIGGLGNDELLGEAGDDTITGGAGADKMDGGGNTAAGDTVSYAGSAGGVLVDLSGVTDIALGGDADGDTISGFENVIGSDKNDQLRGDDGKNVLNGGDGVDILIGGKGDDTLNGGIAGDADVASYFNAESAVTVDLSTAIGTATGGDGNDTLINITDVVGSIFNDELTGNGGNNLLQGNAGEDKLTGGGGNDILNGGAGGDELIGGAGNDTAVYAQDTVGVAVDLAAQTAGGVGSEAALDTLSSIENVLGGTGNDTLTGSAGVNSLSGGGGDDTLNRTGRRRPSQRRRRFRHRGLFGHRQCRATRGSKSRSPKTMSRPRLPLAAGAVTSDAIGDVLSNIENITGGAGNDTITGNSKANKLEGGDGDDTLDWRRGQRHVRWWRRQRHDLRRPRRRRSWRRRRHRHLELCGRVRGLGHQSRHPETIF